MLYAFLRKCAKLFYVIVYNITVIGRENIPEEKGGYIIASNHVSNNDPPVVGITFKGKYTFMAKEELFHKNPIFTWLITKLGAFPVKRGAKDGAQAIEKALQSLKEGRIFVIFPEGTRSKDGTLGRAKSGVTLIAAQAKAPVVPVFIKYGRKKFRRRVIVSIGEVIPAEKFDVDIEDKRVLKQISATIMDEIAKLQENAPDVD
ncbi:MAG: 1-acyl-sn-glycerol-3-phosphate acyltransferase [Oscillospiraceae bacterium]|nr:1-acyl-sn-glycerol-3-phosphate acyltransferase [Oscillospiraceae bacterium]